MSKKIIIADDNVNLTELLKDVLNRDDAFQVVGVANNGKTCLEMVQEHEPDLLILDFIMPYMDGIAVLNELNSIDLPHMPKIIMMTTFGQNDIAQKALLEGVSYFMLKPFDVSHMYRTVQNILSESHANGLPLSQDLSNYSTLEEEVSELLRQVGIPSNIKGYMYIREAVIMICNRVELSGMMTKNVYPQVAIKFNTTASRVERAIRHSIEVAWTRGPSPEIEESLHSLLRDFKFRPTNSELICLLSDLVKRNRKIAN